MIDNISSLQYCVNIKFSTLCIYFAASLVNVFTPDYIKAVSCSSDVQYNCSSLYDGDSSTLWTPNDNDTSVSVNVTFTHAIESVFVVTVINAFQCTNTKLNITVDTQANMVSLSCRPFACPSIYLWHFMMCNSS